LERIHDGCPLHVRLAGEDENLERFGVNLGHYGEAQAEEDETREASGRGRQPVLRNGPASGFHMLNLARRLVRRLALQFPSEVRTRTTISIRHAGAQDFGPGGHLMLEKLFDQARMPPSSWIVQMIPRPSSRTEDQLVGG
jgi:hypothetical protein